MSDTKFTQGKWLCDATGHDGAIILCGENVNPISGKNVIFMNDKVYDAHLIAAAPEMYKALDDLANGRGLDYPIERLLAKARGEQ